MQGSPRVYLDSVSRPRKVHERVEHAHGDGVGRLPLRDGLGGLLQAHQLLVDEPAGWW